MIKINNFTNLGIKRYYDHNKIGATKQENKSVTKNAALNRQRSALSFGANILNLYNMGSTVEQAKEIDRVFKKLSPDFFTSLGKQCDSFIEELGEFFEGAVKKDTQNMLEENGDMWQIALSILRDSNLPANKILDLNAPVAAKFSSDVIKVPTRSIKSQCEALKEGILNFKKLINGKTNEEQKAMALKDIFQQVINVSKTTQISPQKALSHNVSKVSERFQLIEESTGRVIDEIRPEEFRPLWNQAKQQQKSRVYVA